MGQRGPLIRAPGKLFIAGEYGVLRGGQALVVAVDRFAELNFSRPGNDPFVDALQKHMQISDPPRNIDDRSFHNAERKLGLGSSAAKAVLVAAAKHAPNIQDTNVLADALSAHQKLNGGSGADVATSFHGGHVLFTMGQPPRKAKTRLMPLVILGPHATSTRERIQRDASLWEEAASVGNALIAALEDGHPFLPEVRAAQDILHQIEPDPTARDFMQNVTNKVEKLGGAAKPSGAGAEIMLAFFEDLTISQRVEATKALQDQGLTLLDLKPTERGVHMVEL